MKSLCQVASRSTTRQTSARLVRRSTKTSAVAHPHQDDRGCCTGRLAGAGRPTANTTSNAVKPHKRPCARALSSSPGTSSSRSAVPMPSKPLRDSGLSLPMIGLGTWKSPRGKTWAAVKAAVIAGYRHIDTANDYDNESEIGLALKELMEAGVVKREELFIQSKLWNGNHRKEHVEADLRATLEDLQLDYVDSFVVHWPQACPSTGNLAVRRNGAHHAPASKGSMFPVDEKTGLYSSDDSSHYVETWHAMEALVDKGLARTIGLSNYNRQQIQETMDEAKKYQPCVLQNECHAYLQQKDLIDYCNHIGIVFQAYSPLGSYDRPW